MVQHQFRLWEGMYMAKEREQRGVGAPTAAPEIVAVGFSTSFDQASIEFVGGTATACIVAASGVELAGMSNMFNGSVDLGPGIRVDLPYGK